MTDRSPLEPGTDASPGRAGGGTWHASGEPDGAAGRPSDVTRPNPSATPHADHDPLTVTAFVAGDLAGAEADVARRLVQSCQDCATLAGDVRAIADATSALPRPARTRDFRITVEQAEALRPSGLRRLLPVGRPSLAYARPLGTALATLGLAGLLFTALLSGPSPMSFWDRNALGPAAGGATSGSATVVPGSSGPQEQSDFAAPSATASAAASPAASPADAFGRLPGPAAPSAVPKPLVPATQAPSGSGGGATDQSATGKGTGTSGGSPLGGVPLVPGLSLVALLLGVGLIGAERFARRR